MKSSSSDFFYFFPPTPDVFLAAEFVWSMFSYALVCWEDKTTGDYVAYSWLLGVLSDIGHVLVEAALKVRCSGVCMTQCDSVQDDSGRGSESASWGTMTQTVVRHHGNSALQDVIHKSTSLSRPPENDDSRGNIFNSLEETQLPQKIS